MRQIIYLYKQGYDWFTAQRVNTFYVDSTICENIIVEVSKD